jgi:beta-lactamase superfamily II metal-dependent hydrolase
VVQEQIGSGNSFRFIALSAIAQIQHQPAQRRPWGALSIAAGLLVVVAGVVVIRDRTTDHPADQQRLTVEIPFPGDAFTLGSAQVTVLGPVKSYAETNDTSIVLRLEFGETSFLFTGDMEVEAENDMLDYWDGKLDWNVDVLKVGHHGSYSSTGYRFLREVAPTYSVISCGAANDYGHPHEVTVSRLKDADTVIFRTDRMYTITASSDGENIEFSWGNAYAQPWMPGT